jgi:Protein of unknown function (DUF3375)
MTFEELSLQFKTAKPLMLLRAKSAPFMLSFFFRVFRENHITSITNLELRNKLEGYMEDLEYLQNDEELDSNTLFDDFGLKANQYIEKWSNVGFLRKYPNDLGEDLHELSSDTSKVMKWIEDLEKREFVGTNSRFKDIFFKLKKLIELSTEDVEIRIQELEAKKYEIENEITLLKLGKRPSISDETEIKEEFFELNKMARELLSDFSEVEQNFEQIRKEIHKRYAEKDAVKGSLLLFALDALDEIENKDQGKSFKAFWQFLMDEKKQQEFRALTESLYQLLAERGIEFNNDRFLKNLKRYLHASGRKVIDSNRKLNEKISRVLAEKNLLERRRAIELIGEIRQMAYQLAETPVKEDDFVSFEDRPELNLVDRWDTSEEKENAIVMGFPDGPGGEITDEIDFAALFDQFTIDKRKLMEKIDSALEGKIQVSLKDVVDKYGLERGLSELVGYFSIASSTPHHIILEQTIEPIWIGTRKINVPMILYTNPRISKDGK